MRLVALVQRTRTFWRSSVLIGALGLVVALGVTLTWKRAFRSETTVLYRDTIQTKEGGGETTKQRMERLGPKLRELLFARPKLEQVIREYGLFPEKVDRSMLDATQAMQEAMTFKARSSDTFAISFTYEDPFVAQKVTARLTELMIEEYQRQTLDTATLTRDFLQRELADASSHVEEANRALAIFLAHNPQFQWGLNDSPYAPSFGQGALAGLPIASRSAASPKPAPAAIPQDPQLSQLQRELALVDTKLMPAHVLPSNPAAPMPSTSASGADAQKQRDAAAAALAAAESALAERLITVTSAHPDAISARAKVDAARQNLAAREAALWAARSGTAPASAPSSMAPPANAENAELLRRRDGLLRQMAARRAELARGMAPTDAAPAAAPQDAVKASPDVVELETEWHRLRLELERARDQLRLVQHNAHAADIAADAAEKQSQNEMQILEPAYRPMHPDRGGRRRIFLAGAALALLLAVGYAVGRVLLNDTVLDEGDITALGGPPMLVSLPRLSDPDKPAGEPETSPKAAPSTSQTIAVRDVPPQPAAGRSAFRPTPVRQRAPSHGTPVPPPPAPSRFEDEGAPEIEVREMDDDEPISAILFTPSPTPTDPFDARTVGRCFVTTLRFGSPIPRSPLNAPEESAPAPAPRSAMVKQSPASLAVLPSRPLIQAVLEDPEIEMIGANTNPKSAGIAAKLLQATPEVLASLRILRHRLEQKRGDGGFIVSVVSPGKGEGKTLLAAQLALILSEADRARVVVVEGNLERPSVASTLGVRVPDGASLSAQVRRRMNGGARPWNVSRVTPSLAALAEPCAPAVYPEALHSPHFEAALSALRRTHDYVVIDGPSILGSGDANVIEAMSDGILLLARAAETRASALTRSIQQIGERRILGVVLNNVIQPASSLFMKNAA